MQKISTKTIVMTGMMTAVLAVLSQIQIPMPSGVPVTMQTFGVALCACVLGWKMGTASVAVYLLLGSFGVPVFAGLSGGLGTITGATGGFLIGFLPMALLTGLFTSSKNKVGTILCSTAGLAICHLLGALQFMLLMKMGFVESLMLVSVPYLLKDVISVVAAFVVGAAVRKALNAANILTYA